MTTFHLGLNRRRLRPVLGAALFAALLARPGAAGEDCSGCERLGSLSVALSSIAPPAPRVGDAVRFTFAVDARLPGGVDCSLGQCQLTGGPPVLEGTGAGVLGPTGIVVERQAVEAGAATVELTVSAMTEEACRFLDPELGCQTFFQFVPIQASSGPVEVDVVAPAPTDTPTRTPSPTPTPTRPAVEDDGCAVTRPAAPATALLLPLLLLAGLRAARRLRRDTHG